MRIVAFVASLLAATALSAEDYAADTGARLEQGGAVVTVVPDRAGGLPVGRMQIGAAPFVLWFPGFDCGPELTETAWLRFLPMELQGEVARVVADAATLAEGPDRNDILFPFGSSMAVEPGIMRRVYMTDRPHRGYAWEFMYAEGSRFLSQSPEGSSVLIEEVLEAPGGRDFLALGIPFLVMVGRPVCDAGAPRMALDVFEVTFGAG